MGYVVPQTRLQGHIPHSPVASVLQGCTGRASAAPYFFIWISRGQKKLRKKNQVSTSWGS